MKTHLRRHLVGAALAAVLWNTTTPLIRAATLPEKSKPLVEIAILLDTSGSMSGLIEQAKGQLWGIVNEFINARQNGQAPEVHVALFEFGKSSLPSREGYLRMIQPLTTDLDRISEELFALKTNGGDEYCGWVIREAIDRLAWSNSPEVYRAIFIAGNEPFTQGPVNFVDSCRAAIRDGIIVNTIHCGAEAVGIQTKWQEGAALADGKYMVIDHNQAVVHFAAPQDGEIERLGAALNKTYLAFGVEGPVAVARQTAQDANAAQLAPSGAVLNRAVTKASANYRNETWDLVDAVNGGTRELAEIKTEELPPEMQAMTGAERKNYVESKVRERAELKARIQRLNEERNRHVAEQRKADSATNTLNSVMISTIREQAVRKNFRFE